MPHSIFVESTLLLRWLQSLLLFIDGWNNPDLQLSFDLLMQVNVDSVESEFLENAFQANLLGSQLNVAPTP